MSFLSDRRGNFAIMTAVLSVPLLLAVSLAIDYSMMVRTKSMMQDALDAGLLAAGRMEVPIGQKRKIVQDYVDTQAHNLRLAQLNVQVNPSSSGQGLTGNVTGNYGTLIPKFVKDPAYPISVHAEVKAGNDSFLDVALVLDNTNSLGASGLQAVEAAAQQFRSTVFGAVPDPARVQMAVVPFAGAVNVGRDINRQYLDTSAGARWHARWMELEWVAQIEDGCVQTWDPAPDPGTGEVESFLLAPEWMRAITPAVNYALGEVIGIKPAQSQALGPAQQHGMPNGYTVTSSSRTNCNFLTTPPVINHLDLFDQIPNIRWGGCVEARTETTLAGTRVDYDTNDVVPSQANADTLFVPYFWPDEPDDGRIGADPFVNNYIADYGASLPWNPSTWATFMTWGYAKTPSKYDGRSVSYPSGQEYVSGPNRGCPQPLLPLTKSSTSIQASIANMSLTQGGGTLVSEGVAWGWRVLSPAQPFAQANTNPATKRIMVVMTDGENQLSRNPQTGTTFATGPTVADYNAYGYFRAGRLGTSFEEAESALDSKTLAVCEQAREAGIEIYTVLFRSNSSRAIETLTSCAGSADHFYRADDADALNAVFSGIAASIGRYRLVK